MLQHSDGPAQVAVADEGQVDGVEQGAPGATGGACRAGGTPVLLAQGVGDGQGLALAALQGMGGTGEQLVGDLAEGRGDDDERAAMGGDTGGGAGDGGAIGQRGAPNFQTARGAEWVEATVPLKIRDRWRSLEDLTGV